MTNVLVASRLRKLGAPAAPLRRPASPPCTVHIRARPRRRCMHVASRRMWLQSLRTQRRRQLEVCARRRSASRHWPAKRAHRRADQRPDHSAAPASPRPYRARARAQGASASKARRRLRRAGPSYPDNPLGGGSSRRRARQEGAERRAEADVPSRAAPLASKQLGRGRGTLGGRDGVIASSPSMRVRRRVRRWVRQWAWRAPPLDPCPCALRRWRIGHREEAERGAESSGA